MLAGVYRVHTVPRSARACLVRSYVTREGFLFACKLAKGVCS